MGEIVYKECTVHAPLRGPAYRDREAPEIRIPVTISNQSTHIVMPHAYVVIRDIGSGQSGHAYFGKIPVGKQETSNAYWLLYNDEQGQPIYPTDLIYTINAEDGGGWHNLLDSGPFNASRIYLYDSDWSPS